MADADGETEIPYERPLDRSPEKEGFAQLPQPDKALVCQLRSAMLGARDKFTQLRDEAEDRERDATREAALRKAAETRLEQLVDMYGDPAVMDELKERLPRASHSDHHGQWERELREMRERGGDQDESSPEKSGKDQTDARDPSRRSHSPPGVYSNHPDRPYPGYPPVPSYGAYYPPPPGLYPAPPQVVYMAAPGPGAQGSGASAPGAPYMVQALANQSVSSGSGDPGATGAGSGSPGQHAQAPSASAAAAKDITVNREQNRQIMLLLAELDAARGLNKKLQAQLSTTQQELQSLKITSQTKESLLRAEASGKAAALVEEIYRAQKERDEAMMGRLRTANEERDEALLKLRRRDMEPSEMDLVPEQDNLDKDLKKLLADLGDLDSTAQIDQQGRHLVDAINRQKQRRRQITTEEMKAVLEERDSAVAKCQKQEGELLRFQRQLRGKTPEKQQQATLQAKLLTTQQERDMALAKLRKMEDELQTLRVYYSLHKSLSQEANLRDQFNNTLETYQGQLKHRDVIVDQAQKEKNHLVAQLNTASMDRAKIEGAVSKLQGKIRTLEDTNLKQEKVIGLLRERVKDMAAPIED